MKDREIRIFINEPLKNYAGQTYYYVGPAKLVDNFKIVLPFSIYCDKTKRKIPVIVSFFPFDIITLFEDNIITKIGED